MPRSEDYPTRAKLYESANSLVFRARERATDRPVILKYLKRDYPSPQELARYRQEFEITRALDLPDVIDVYAQFRDRKSLVMVLEDFGGESLSVLSRERRFSLFEVLSLGARIAEALAKVHERRVIHKDINPGNIVYCRTSDTLKLIDFGIATQLPRQSKTLTSLQQLEGTLAYLSPEQTGRVNRDLDYRTDFYSLGVTLYELLCGQRPFTESDPMQLIHSHIARPPRPPHEVDEAVPLAVSKLVMKLLAKSAEDRYLSGWGISADLRACLNALMAGEALAPFELGRCETPPQLEIPQKLYGRETEIRKLLELFGRASRGPAQMILVSGYSGIGKTSLVQEIHRPITLTRGYFTSGKFDQLQRIPYAALSQALSGLIRQLLTESKAQLAFFRQRLTATLRADAQVLVEMIPDLVKIIGPQPPVQVLGPAETNLRLRRLLIAFLQVFCAPEHPLVVFIDDLQWADSLSLELLEAILREGELENLLIVGAYRDNEVDALHPLAVMRETLRTHGFPLDELSLPDLNEQHIKDLLADTLAAAPARVAALADTIKQKTGGNPFFIRQLLRSLYADGLLVLEPANEEGRREWRWNLDEIAALGFTDNVVDLMLSRLKQLPPPTQSALQQAACLGNRFDLQTLAIIAKRSLREAHDDLQPAAQAGFVLPTSELVTSESDEGTLELVVMDYRFLHDRVQQAAYALTPDARKQALHTTIGRLMLASFDPEERDRRIFELVDHLNRGLPPEECSAQLELARLNLEAAQKAKQATAFSASRQYIEQAALVMPADIWDTDHALAMNICALRIEMESISAHYDVAEDLARDALSRARSVLEKAGIQRVLISQRTMLSQYEEGISLGLEALAGLGVEFPRARLDELLSSDHAAIMRVLERRGVASLLELDDCRVPEEEQKIVLLSALIAVTYQADPALMTVICTRIILLTFEVGLHPEAVLGFAAYAILLGVRFQEYTLGYQLGEFAFAIADRFSDRTQRCRATNVMVGHLGHWARSFEANEELIRRGFQAGVEVGEQQYSSYMLAHHAVNCWVAGEPLEELLARVTTYFEHIRRTKNEISSLQLTALSLVIADAREGADEAGEAAFLRAAKADQNYLPICQFEITKAQLLYYDQRYREALDLLRSAGEKLAYIPGCSPLGEYYFYLCLTLAALCPGLEDPQGRARHLTEIAEHKRQIEIFASHCPANFAHELALIEAEIARLEGRSSEAIDAYDRAIELSAASGRIQDEALAHSLASAFFAARGKARISEAYLLDSYQSFRTWGAQRIVARLEANHPRLFSRDRPDARAHTTTSTSTSGLGRALDLDTVIRASRAITNARELEALLHTVMEISLENAGAERGFLILAREGGLIAKARGQWTTSAQIELMSSELDELDELSPGIVRYVARTGEPIVLDDAHAEGPFTEDPYVLRVCARSVLCLPLLNQGSLIAVVFMENRKIAAAFSSDRIDILRLLMTPAAMAIENAQLKRAQEGTRFTYQVGGSLPAGSHSYVTRRADRELDHRLRAGSFCYVLCPRQMGKSSLRVHTMRRLHDEGRVCVALDLSMIGNRQVTAEQWYAGVARGLLGGLNLNQEVSLRQWWQEHNHLPAVQRLVELFDSEILTRIHEDIVVFFDEIDSVLSLGFDYDDFFAMIRGLFNRRAEDPRYQRLSFVILGVASPAELVRDPTRTPFNIGHRIHLEHFTATECAPLMVGLADTCAPELVLEAILAWTNGQPLLTQKVCGILHELETTPRPGQESAWVGRAVRAQIIERWQEQDEPIHLRAIQERILHSPRRRSLLQLYRQIFRHAGELAATGSSLETELLLTGLVICTHDKLSVSNRIYEEIFDLPWISTHDRAPAAPQETQS